MVSQLCDYTKKHLKRVNLGTYLEVQWLGLCFPMQEVRVQSLVGELGSHIPWGQKKRPRHKTQAILWQVQWRR